MKGDQKRDEVPGIKLNVVKLNVNQSRRLSKRHTHTTEKKLMSHYLEEKQHQSNDTRNR